MQSSPPAVQAAFFLIPGDRGQLLEAYDYYFYYYYHYYDVLLVCFIIIITIPITIIMFIIINIVITIAGGSSSRQPSGGSGTPSASACATGYLLMGPADYNHCNCNRMSFGESGRLQSIVVQALNEFVVTDSSRRVPAPGARRRGPPGTSP